MRLGRLILAILAPGAVGVAVISANSGGSRGPDDVGAASAPVVSAPLDASQLTQAFTLDSPLLRRRPKVDSQLDLLYRIDVLARAGGRRIDASDASRLPPPLRAAIAGGRLRLDAQGFVQVYAVAAAPPADTADALRRIGMRIEIASGEYGLVQGWLPVGAIDNAAALPEVQALRPPPYAMSATGTATTAGDAILDVNDLRSIFGVNGAGVRVGVISDGLEGLTSAQSSGDLPGSVNTTCDFGAGLPTDAGAGAEGTALLEIVHDLAPGAELWFGYFALGTDLDFISTVDCLADNVDVIIDDTIWYNVGLYDGTSNVSQNLVSEMNNATNRARAYVNAAGNEALRHYQEPYINSGAQVTGTSPDFWVVHRYQATASTTDGGFGFACPNFGSCGDEVTLPPGAIVAVALQWNDPFLSSTNDYDLLLFDESLNQIFLASAFVQDGAGSSPLESFAYQNTTGVQKKVDILIGNYQGAAAARTFDMFILCNGCPAYSNGANHNFNTLSSSVPNNSDAGSPLISLGAINASDPGNDTVAPYSSRGPTNDGRLKPEAVAIDGVVVTGAAGFPSPFFGTSAAAPHGGAIAALILACKPSLKHGEPGDNPNADRDALRSAMFNSAVDLGVAGDDQVYGNGRIDADAAATAAGCPPLPATPTPTPTSTPTPGDEDSDGMPDDYEAVRACLNPVVFDGILDLDGDGLTSFFEYSTSGTEPCEYDDDGDGCADGEEVEGGRPHQSGGQRDPLNGYDFYDVNGSGRIDGADIGLVRFNFTGGAPTPPEDAIYDRSSGANFWAPNGPDGFINAVDIGLVRGAFNDRCDLAP